MYHEALTEMCHVDSKAVAETSAYVTSQVVFSTVIGIIRIPMSRGAVQTQIKIYIIHHEYSVGAEVEVAGTAMPREELLQGSRREKCSCASNRGNKRVLLGVGR